MEVKEDFFKKDYFFIYLLSLKKGKLQEKK